jgi:[glutamine synthetase] adenylyltransferase / [glutamine synthetase]-adenylyl-L-tyrosine phosphorylase
MPVDPFSANEIKQILNPFGFKDIQSASAILQRLGKNPSIRSHLEKILPYLLNILATVGNSDRVIASLDRMLENSADASAVLTLYAENPRQLEILARAFAGSQYLSEILLLDPEYLNRIYSSNQLTHHKSSTQYFYEAQEAAQTAVTPDHVHNTLRRYQRQELLRIGIADLLGLFDLTAATRQLSNLADGLVNACLHQVGFQLNMPQKNFVVLGLGKLGGGELNYSSDIDLLFISRQDPSHYLQLCKKLIDALSNITEEGFLYRVDMRLRPWGSLGSLVSSLQGYLKYLEKNARLWEKQALLKTRVIAGDQELGQQFLAQIAPLMYSDSIDDVRESILEMKLRTEKSLRLQGREYGEVKLGQGSIRDIEFVVQYLQLAHGKERPQIRNNNTLQSLLSLQNAGLIDPDEAHILTDGYVFLRTIEHHLQLNEYRQTHQLPSKPEAIHDLARRLGFMTEHASTNLMTRYMQHSSAIRAVFLHYIGNQSMSKNDPTTKPQKPFTSSFNNHIQRMDPSYTATFSSDEIHHHAEMADCLDQNHLVVVDARQMEDGLWRATIVAYDYLGELSIICGLMFVYGLNILGGEVFTYETSTTQPKSQYTHKDERKKIVDVFTVQPENPDFSAENWDQYTEDLSALLQMMDSGERRSARGELAKRVAQIMHETTIEKSPLYPIEIIIDNNWSDRYTVLFIESVDTIGFLYELTNALAYSQIYIARVMIDSAGNHVRDTLYVSDERGNKITDPTRLRELRAAVVLTKHFTHLLPHSPNPVSALLHFRDFIAQLFERPNWTDELTSLEQPEVLHGLAQLLGVSDFLWDDFLRLQYANIFPIVHDLDALDTVKSRQRLQSELETSLLTVHVEPQPPRDDASWIQNLNEFKDREMFRIDMRHILGHTKEFWDFASELTDLAEVVVNTAYHLAAEDLRTVYGTPLLEVGSTSQMAVLALGKCGGKELGFASDIELMFLYSGNGQTTGPETISSAEFHEKTVQFLIRAIKAKREGIFEIDLQLRPYGKAGSLAVSLEAFKRYFAPGGPAWNYERQALVKLRPIAGDESLGNLVCALRDEFIYTGEAFDVTAMHAMRERQLRHLVTAGSFHPKFSPGGLVDIEYFVQGMQMNYGHQYPELRNTNTRETITALYEIGILSEEDYTKLRKAHTFLRWLIDSLRVVRGNAKDIHIPPQDSEEFAYLTRRLRFGSDLIRLQANLAIHTANVLDINQRLLRAKN